LTTLCRASDPDAGVNGEVSYSLSARSAADFGRLFAVDARSGVISQRLPVDFERHRDPITLHVVARDGGKGTIPAMARVVVAVRDVNDHAPDIRLETTGTGSDVTGSEIGIGVGKSGSGISGREKDVDESGTGTGSDDAASDVTGTGSESAVVVSEHGATGEFVAHVSVRDPDSDNAGRVHCAMPSSHFSLVRMYPNEYKVDRRVCSVQSSSCPCPFLSTPLSARVGDNTQNRYRVVPTWKLSDKLV